jgi:RNA polymerase sigma factor (sigma-70 family)
MPELPNEFIRLLDLHRNGDPGARKKLMFRHCVRLLKLSSRTLRRLPDSSRWEETDDVWREALRRLWRTLGKFRPESNLHYCRLAHEQIIRTLIDLARHYQGLEGDVANHHTDPARCADDSGGTVEQQALDVEELWKLAQWEEFYRLVERLPEQQRDVFGLLWLQGVSPEEAAEVLDLAPTTLWRRLHEASLALGRMMRQCPVF